MNYRFDKRSKEEFIQDIKQTINIEDEIFHKWINIIGQPKYKKNGCGKNGEFLPDKKVSTAADYEVENYGRIEVKFSRKNLKTHFHLKVGQVKSYLKQNASILMINDYNGDPTYVLINPTILEKISNTCKIVPFQGFGSKASYKIPISTLIWRPLNDKV
jgi:hypothetical protein